MKTRIQRLITLVVLPCSVAFALSTSVASADSNSTLPSDAKAFSGKDAIMPSGNPGSQGWFYARNLVWAADPAMAEKVPTRAEITQFFCESMGYSRAEYWEFGDTAAVRELGLSPWINVQYMIHRDPSGKPVVDQSGYNQNPKELEFLLVAVCSGKN